jgi:hypothetical protein
VRTFERLSSSATGKSSSKVQAIAPKAAAHLSFSKGVLEGAYPHLEDARRRDVELREQEDEAQKMKMEFDTAAQAKADAAATATAKAAEERREAERVRKEQQKLMVEQWQRDKLHVADYDETPADADETGAEAEALEHELLQSQNKGREIRVELTEATNRIVTTTAQMGLGRQLAPSPEALLTMMSRLVSLSAALQFVLLPLTGKVSDTVGRKPIMLVRYLCSGTFALLLALRPNYLTLCVARMMQNMTWQLNQTAVDASLADLFEGEALATASSQIMSQSGVAMLFGPLLGGRLASYSFGLCYGLSSLAGFTGAAVVMFGLTETLGSRDGDRGEGGASAGKQQPAVRSWSEALNPLGFTRLLTSGRPLACLTLASTLSDVCDGTYEIDRHYGIDTAGMSFTQDGLFNSLRGAATTCSTCTICPSSPL